MELLSPSHPPSPTANFFSRISFPATTRPGFDPLARSYPSPTRVTAEDSGFKVYVAVGKSVDKAVPLLHWASRRFENAEICILHVHQPSHFIPTLLGKLPASQANPKIVSAFRQQEKEELSRLLNNYLSTCSKFKVTNFSLLWWNKVHHRSDE